MKKTLYALLPLFMFSCGGNQNETSLFKDLPLENGSSTNHEIESSKVNRRLGTIVKETKLRINPLDTTDVKILMSGDRVSLLNDTLFVSELNKKFVKVQNQYQEQGWIEESTIILDTKVGVVIKTIEVFDSPDIFAKRTEVINYGEIVLSLIHI